MAEEEKPAEETSDESVPAEGEDVGDTERTEDLMNPEGAPTPEELSTVE